jgi:ribose transport system ATP-binding protein
VFLSSEIEEFLNLCTRVFVFRNGAISSEFTPPYNSHALLNAMFGRKPSAALFEEPVEEMLSDDSSPPRSGNSWPHSGDGRPTPRPVPTTAKPQETLKTSEEPLVLSSPDMGPGTIMPTRFAEDSKVSPPLAWSGVPEGTRSLALSMVDPDLPPQFNFPRAFAHWLVYDIPTSTGSLPEGASQSARMPVGAKELNSDFVTFRIQGFGRGYGGPWPPDRRHRYLFTLHALMVDHLDLDPDADLPAFSAAVGPRTIASASFTTVYGPARKPLPS